MQIARKPAVRGRIECVRYSNSSLMRTLLIWPFIVFLGHTAVAQTLPPDYLSRPVSIIVGFSAGSTNDTTARVVANRLSDVLGQRFIVVNREGASGAMSGQIVAKSKPDGQTLMWGSSANLITAPAFYQTYLYDADTDFSPISAFCYVPYMIVVHPSMPATNLKSLLDLTRQQPDKLAYGSTGVGGTLHLAIELMQHMGKVKLLHVPYKGTPGLIVDLVAGQIQLGVMSVNLVVPYVRSNRMRAIAVTAMQRADLLPNVPTMDESGMKGYDVSGMYGLVAPAKTPTTIITHLYKGLLQALEHPEAKAVIARESGRAGGDSPEKFAEFLRTERAKYRKLIDAANLRREMKPSDL